MPTKIIVADKEGMVYLNCPSCRNISPQPVDHFLNVPQPLHISCTCGNTYEVQIEFRKSFRKKIHLEGFYARPVPSSSFEKMTIIDISMGGCRFFAYSAYHLRKDDRIKLTFNLDNANCTKITRDAKICSVDKWSVGCKFFVTCGSFDTDIGFYLRSA
jgi:hypothetical protein